MLITCPRSPATLASISAVNGCEPRGQHGFALISAIFILVVLAVLGAAVAHLSVNQQLGSAVELTTAKAYQAARAGQEWAAFQVLIPAPPSPPTADTPPACFSDTHIALTGELTGFTVSVQCTRSGPVVDGDSSKTFYQVTATACNTPTAGSCLLPPAAPSAVYVERRLSWTLAR